MEKADGDPEFKTFHQCPVYCQCYHFLLSRRGEPILDEHDLRRPSNKPASDLTASLGTWIGIF